MRNVLHQTFIFLLSIILIIDYSSFSVKAEETKIIVKKVAIVGFSGNLIIYEYKNNTRIQKNEPIDLTDSLINKLVPYKSIGILERNRLDSAIKELGFSQSGFVEKSKELGKFVGADYIAFGTITNAGDNSEIGVRVIDVESGIIVSSKTVKFNNTHNNANLLEIIDYISMEIALSLGEKIDEVTLKNKRDLFENYSSNQNLWWIGSTVLLLGALIGFGVVSKSLGLDKTYK